MSNTIDIKPVFSSIRIKTEPVEYKDDIKPRKINLEDMVRRRKYIKRRGGKKGGRRRKKKRKFKRKKRAPATTAHRPNTVESVRKAFIRNLGIDAEIERGDFCAVIPEVPSLPESEEKISPSPPVLKDIKDISDISIAPPEDLLDAIMEKQEQMFSQNFKSKKRQLTQDEMREKDERRMKRQEAKEEKRRIEEENRRRQREIREREKREQERLERETRALCDIMPSNDSPFSPPPKRKSRFSDDQVPFVNAFNRNPDKIPIIHRAPDQLPPPLPLPTITSNTFNPALAFLQQANFEQTLHQNALLQQQFNLECLAAASFQSSVNPLVAQMLQNVLPQPQHHLFLPQQPPPQHLIGMPPPPPPPDNSLFNFGNNGLIQQQPMINTHQSTADTPGSSSMFLSDPPPPPLFDDIIPCASKDSKKTHVNSIASLVKPYADKYGKRYKLSTENYKKMCVKIVKKVAKYNTPPKPDRIERLVQEYAHYLHQKADRQKRKQ